MSKEYEYKDKESQMVSDTVMQYNNAMHQRPVIPFHIAEDTNLQKKKFLQNNLHFSTAQYLESQDWLEDKPFPTYADSDDEAWIDEAEAMGTNDIVHEDIINIDRLAWNSLR